MADTYIKIRNITYVKIKSRKEFTCDDCDLHNIRTTLDNLCAINEVTAVPVCSNDGGNHYLRKLKIKEILKSL